MKNIVFITHRHHYHICQVSILLALKQFKPDRIVIAFDDIPGTQAGWNDMGKMLSKDLRNIGQFRLGKLCILPFSSIANIHTEPMGWIRQQYLKLNLHKVLPGDEWLVIDGDVLINDEIDPWKYCYINASDTFRLHHDFFVRYTLNLENERVCFDGSPLEFSSVPIRLLTRKTLQGLEEYIQELHGTDIRGIRDSFTLKKNKEYYLELSEYDLIGNYQHFISKDLLPLKNLEIHFEPKERLYTNWKFLKNKISVLHGKDNLPFEWYHQFGININQDVWNLLYDIKK